MSGDSYLQSVVSTCFVLTGEGSVAFSAAQSLYPMIQRWAGVQLRGVNFSGSYAKGTAIKGRTDVDLFISLKADTKETLKEIFDSLCGRVRSQGYQSARKQNVSIHIVHGAVEVDLVPALHLGGNTEDHWLYVNKTNKERIKTNVNTHIGVVANSGRINEIILAKRWRNLHGLEFPSFYLELAVIEALRGRQSGQLADNFWAVLGYLAGDFDKARFVDPANTNNIISEDTTVAEKQAIKNKALESRRQQNWDTIVW